jgi:hypothetical protein
LIEHHPDGIVNLANEDDPNQGDGNVARNRILTARGRNGGSVPPARGQRRHIGAPSGAPSCDTPCHAPAARLIARTTRKEPNMQFVAALSRFVGEYRQIMEQARTGKVTHDRRRAQSRKG